MLKQYNDPWDMHNDSYTLVSKEDFMKEHADDYTPEQLEKVYDYLDGIGYGPDDPVELMSSLFVEHILEEIERQETMVYE